MRIIYRVLLAGFVFGFSNDVLIAEESSRPLIVAHRGLLLHAPENTLANFRACLELHLGFEFDVEKAKDGQLVCNHDDTVDRTTNGTGKVSQLTLEEIRRLDAGSWFDHKFAGEKMPTIEEVLKLVAEYQQHDVLIAVDLKPAIMTAFQAITKSITEHLGDARFNRPPLPAKRHGFSPPFTGAIAGNSGIVTASVRLL